MKSWLPLFASYLLFAGSVSAAELAAGAICAALAAGALVILQMKGSGRFPFELCWLARLGKVPWTVVKDFAVWSRAFARRMILRETVPGRFRDWPFAAPDPHAAAKTRRALVVSAISLSPNTYVASCRERRGRDISSF